MENTSSVAYNATDKAEKKSAASPKINVTSRTKYLVELALMIAIVVLMAYTPLGYIKTPVLSVTLLTVPVAIGAAILGPKAGAVLGLTFGATSFINSLTGQSAFMTLLMGVSPFWSFCNNCRCKSIMWLVHRPYLQGSSLNKGNSENLLLCFKPCLSSAQHSLLYEQPYNLFLRHS